MTHATPHVAGLPPAARRPINRCNLPPSIIGGLTYQQHPVPLMIDGVAQFYRDVFKRLSTLDDAVVRSRHFMDYMAIRFQLCSPHEMGLQKSSRLNRAKATYLKLLRGWFFNPDSQEGAVLKGWVESRFGLVPRFHRSPIRSAESNSYRAFEQEWARGLYNTNALEMQLDLLFSYCQFELSRKFSNRTHLTLYRGINRLDEYESLGRSIGTDQPILLLNNLNAFSITKARACEFGDYVIQVDVPIYKIAFYTQLLPGMLAGEEEYVVLGGLYRTQLV